MIKKKLKTLRHKRALKKALNEADLEAGNFIPTLQDAEKWFKLINNAIFKGEVQDPDLIEIRRRHGKWGEVEVKPDKEGFPFRILSLTDKYPTEQMFINTISHETVHLYEYQKHGKMEHGRFFKRYSDIFKKHGIEL